MDSEPILDQQNATSQVAAKLNFLENEKERLEFIVYQLTTNCNLLRKINESIVKDLPESLSKDLNTQNKLLQASYQRILQQNQDLITQKFLNQQIQLQNEAEFRQILQNYQERILQLRKSIQMKQCHVQTLQSNIKYNQEVNKNFLGPHTISMMFNQQLDEYKTRVEVLNKKNKALKNQNQAMKSQLLMLREKQRIIQNLTTSQVSYFQFKNLYRQTQKSRSTPKKEVFLGLVKQWQNNSQVSKNSNWQIKSGKMEQLTSMVIKKSHEIDLLLKKIREMELKTQQQEEIIKKIQAANKVYENNRLSKITELNYYKKYTQELFKLFMQRKANRRAQSHNRTEAQAIARDVNLPRQITYVTDRKKLWLQIKQTLSGPQFKTFQKTLKNHKQRCMSSIGDYVHLKQDEVDKYLAKHNPQTQQMPNNNNFSMMLQMCANGQKDPFEFSVIKNQRLTYADMKRKKGGIKNGKKLTLIQEDIF